MANPYSRLAPMERPTGLAADWSQFPQVPPEIVGRRLCINGPSSWPLIADKNDLASAHSHPDIGAAKMR